MQGTILVLDGIATNRIMLRVQLSAAWYHVAQGRSLADLRDLVGRCRPDAIVSAMVLPDGSAADIPALLSGIGGHPAGIPVIAIAESIDRDARLRALAAGVDEVFVQPVGDALLQSRLRSLIRDRVAAEDLALQDSARRSVGLADPVAPFVPAINPARVALISHGAAMGPAWRTEANDLWRPAQRMDFKEARRALPRGNFQAAVVDLTDPPDASGAGQALRLVADLSGHTGQRRPIIIAVAIREQGDRAAEALDRGAQDVLCHGFCADELGLKLSRLLRRRAWAETVRGGIRDGLRAAVTDPMTGLFNRRYAMPKLAGIAERAARCGDGLAVLMADLDHFKQVNDRFGHSAGDAVLVECARRLRGVLVPKDIIARIGGEEFLIALPGCDAGRALATAEKLRRSIDHAPFRVDGCERPVAVTISIGVAVVSPAHGRDPAARDLPPASRLIAQADGALYEAKSAGRNRISLAAAWPSQSSPAYRSSG